MTLDNKNLISTFLGSSDFCASNNEICSRYSWDIKWVDARMNGWTTWQHNVSGPGFCRSKKMTRAQIFMFITLINSTEESVAVHCFADRSRGLGRFRVGNLTSLGLEIMMTKSLSRNDLISAFRSKKELGFVPNDCGEGRCDRALNCWNCT